MLVVMELSDAIPLELIPRIKQEDLVQRGKFELVSVTTGSGTQSEPASEPLRLALGRHNLNMFSSTTVVSATASSSDIVGCGLVVAVSGKMAAHY